MPFLLIALAGIGYVAAKQHAASDVPVGLTALLTVNLPAILFLTAVCLVLSTVIWTPAVGFICAGVWIWVQLDPAQNPSLANSVLSPYGDYALAGLFGADRIARSHAGSPGLIHIGPLGPPVSVMTGILSVLLIVGMALALLGALPAVERRRQLS